MVITSKKKGKERKKRKKNKEVKMEEGTWNYFHVCLKYIHLYTTHSTHMYEREREREREREKKEKKRGKEEGEGEGKGEGEGRGRGERDAAWRAHLKLKEAIIEACGSLGRR